MTSTDAVAADIRMPAGVRAGGVYPRIRLRARPLPGLAGVVSSKASGRREAWAAEYVGASRVAESKCLLIVLCQRPQVAFCRTPNGEAMLADQFVAAAAARNTHTVDEVVRQRGELMQRILIRAVAFATLALSTSSDPASE